MSEYWRDDLLPASLGGVPFEIESTSSTPGRRTAIQEFPGTDFVRGQDLGPKAKRFSIQGYLIGRDYHQQRQRLEAVFDRPGPHVLVHPYRGRMLVHLEGDPDISESKAKGGFASVTFKVVKASSDDGRPITSSADTAAASVATARAAATESLGAGLDVSATSSAALATSAGSVQVSLSASLGAGLDTTTSAGLTVSQTVAGMTAAVAAATTGAAVLTAVTSAVRAVLQAPLAADFVIEGAYGELTDGQRVAVVLDLAKQFVGAIDNGLTALTTSCLLDAPASDATAIDVATWNAQAITAAVRAEAAATALETVITTPPDSSAQAREALDAIEALLSGATDGDPDGLLHAVDPETYTALADLRSAAARYLNDQALQLPTVATVVVDTQTNALLLAQRLLGDASRWAEIAQRNDLADPLLIPAGTTIEFLRPLA